MGSFCGEPQVYCRQRGASGLSKAESLLIAPLGCHLHRLPWLWLEEEMEGWEND